MGLPLWGSVPAVRPAVACFSPVPIFAPKSAPIFAPKIGTQKLRSSITRNFCAELLCWGSPLMEAVEDGPPARAPVASRSRAWCFTLNNPDFVPCLVDWSSAVYLCYGHEFAPDTGTPHLQGYLYLKNAVSLAFVRSGLDTAHWEPARGSPAQNRDYCSKDGIFFEEGVLPTQGKRSDLVDLHRSLQSGSSLRSISNDHFASFVRYQRGIGAYRLLNAPQRSSPPRILIYWGASGTGKSSRAHAEFPDAYWKPSGKWWDGYDGHETVIWDEFYGHSLSYTDLLRVLDRYPIYVETKGGSTQLHFTTIVFTSNQSPSQWYSPDVYHAPDFASSALGRRFREFGTIVQFPLTPHLAMAQRATIEDGRVADPIGSLEEEAEGPRVFPLPPCLRCGSVPEMLRNGLCVQCFFMS